MNAYIGSSIDAIRVSLDIWLQGEGRKVKETKEEIFKYQPSRLPYLDLISIAGYGTIHPESICIDIFYYN